MGDLAILIANDRERQRTAGDLGDVVDPTIVRLDRIGGQADQLDAALGELGLVLGQICQFGGADRGVVFGVGEEDDPVVADPLIEVDTTDGSVGLEVGGFGSQAESVDCGIVR